MTGRLVTFLDFTMPAFPIARLQQKSADPNQQSHVPSNDMSLKPLPASPHLLDPLNRYPIAKCALLYALSSRIDDAHCPTLPIFCLINLRNALYNVASKK